MDTKKSKRKADLATAARAVTRALMVTTTHRTKSKAQTMTRMQCTPNKVQSFGQASICCQSYGEGCVTVCESDNEVRVR